MFGTSSQRDRMAALLTYALLVVLAVRLLTLGAYPLTDSTEARYAEIARVMLVTGDWITPQLEPGSPFWAKPPLYAWLTAASFAVFGVNDFAARLPHFVLCLGVLLVMARLRPATADRMAPRLAQLVLASSFMFFVASGAVMTDMALLLGVTMAMVGFWRRQCLGGHRWQILFFVGLAVGLLAKGPLVLVLTALPLLLWLVIYGRWQALKGFGWYAGTFLVLAIAGPWYLAAELKTPGFVDYFLVGEHLLRFIQPGWDGDLYGNAHDRARGTIWLYWLVAALPWTPVFGYLLWRQWRERQLQNTFVKSPESAWHGYLLCWTLAPMVFFSFAGNILPPYVLPGMPAFAWLVTQLLVQVPATTPGRRIPGLITAAAIAPITLVILIGFYASDRLAIRSEKPLVGLFNELASHESMLLHYFGQRPMSAAFYSRGTVKSLDDWSQITFTQDEAWVAARHHEVIPIENCLETGSNLRYRLLRCRSSSASK
jgi:4-amino-4-deoxy-L-arabinose transferase-like glycosyltransferase